MLLLISTLSNLVARQVLESTLPGFKPTPLDWFIVGAPQALVGPAVTRLVVFNQLRSEERGWQRLPEL